MNHIISKCLDFESHNLDHQDCAKPNETIFINIRLEAIENCELFAKRLVQVIQLVNANSKVWPNDQLWSEILPSWFINFCKPEMNKEESDKWLAWWRTLNEIDKKQAEENKGWSLADWLYWLKPENRVWFFGSIKFQEIQGVTIDIFCIEDMPPLGALEWLIKASKHNPRSS